jgi:hypothetical protein
MRGDDHEVESTPDGRYIIVRERLWRASNPNLDDEERQALVNDLMSGRRAVARAKRTDDAEALTKARALVHSAKVHLGERGAVWWTDGAPDYNKHMVRNTPYAEWWEQRRLNL